MGKPHSQSFSKAQTEIGIRNTVEKYVPMDEVTRNSLRHALKEAGVKPPLLEDLETKAMGKYNELEVFPDAARFFHQLPAISANLKHRGIDIEYLIFSNGTPNMVEAAISNSDLLSATFGKKRYISVDAIKVFKPSPKTYKYVLEKLGKDTGKDVFLVSGNPFDITGAKNAGLGTIWVNRSVNGQGWVDTLLGEEGKGPEHVLKGLDDLESVFDKI